MVKWNAEYDVVVLGFGGAGATAARFAADNGAKVLLVDSAPEGNEGGNTRYSAQMVSISDNFDAEKKYFNKMTEPMHLDENVKDTFVQGMVDMPEYFKKYLGVTKPMDWRKCWDLPAFAAKRKPMVANTVEYPEYPGADHHNVYNVHLGTFDAALWKILRQNVIDRKDKITIWYESPAKHLIQDPNTKEILGVQIERQGHNVNVRAKNGVVLATGGFENNQTMIEDYLGATKLAPLGTLYNKGAGIHMAEEIGADMWHMNNFESLGLLHGMAFAPGDGKRGKLIVKDWKNLYSGSIFLIADDGSRYFNEAAPNRHGHVYQHGHWVVPKNQVHPALVFDQKQYDKFATEDGISYPVVEHAIKADTIEELAEKLDVPADNLKQTLDEFNFFAEQGKDYAYHRDGEFLEKFSESGPYYGVKMNQTILNTQGGPRRNEKAEILNPDGEPIPHLYGAGELGGLSAGTYQAGENLAECLIFGKIAGENAAKSKEETPEYDVVTGASEVEVDLESDVKDNVDYSTKKNQYIGKSSLGMGDGIVVRTTLDDQNNIKNIEVLKQNESGDYGLKAIKEMPAEMIKENTYEIDAVSGASATSRALKAAVKDSLEQANK